MCLTFMFSPVWVAGPRQHWSILFETEEGANVADSSERYK